MGMFDGEVENSYELMPEGIYNASVSKVEKKTSNAGNEYISIEFTLTNGRKVWDMIMWHSETVLNIAKGKLEMLGFTRDQRKELTPNDLEAAIKEIVADKRYDVKIGIRKDQNNEDKNNVKSFKEAEEAPF